MTKYLLDTNICIYLIKKKPKTVLERLKKCSLDQIFISSITYAELEYGVAKSSNPEKNAAALQEFLIPFQVLPWDSKAAQFDGHIRAFLEKKGTPIGVHDEMISAHALSLEMTLVSNNIKHFKRIPEISIENWV